MIRRTAGRTRTPMRAAALAVALIGTFGFGPAAAASAATPASPVVDPTRLASITLNAVENDTAGSHPFPGVAFTIQRITDIDLSTTAGWAEAFTLSSQFDPANAVSSITGHGHTLATGSTGISGNDGVVAFTGLHIGAYLVTQEIPTLAHTKTMAPFVVLLPVTNADGTGWTYHVELTPKNDVVPVSVPTDFATKTVSNPDGHHVGDLITWHITGRILPGGDVLWWREIDPLDSRLEYVSVNAWLSDGTPMIEGSDFEMIQNAATNTVTFEVLGPPRTAGLAKITAHKAADPNTFVEIDLVTRVLDASTIPNQAIINTATWDDPVGIVRTATPPTGVATITPAPPFLPPGLSSTGVNVVLPALVGAGLVTLGFFIVVAVRRRRETREVSA